MAKKVIVGKTVFLTKKAALEAVRKVLNGAPIGADLDAESFIFIREFLDLHPRRAEKLAKGCQAIRVEINRIPGMPPQRGFHVVCDDGSTIDFSIYAPLQSEDQRRRGDLNWAARMAIADGVKTFKKGAFRNRDVRCAVTGEPVEWDNAHVDHDQPWPFKRILNAWLANRSAPPDLIDHGISSEMTPEDALNFCAFHDGVARLRIVHKTENLRPGARGA